jgi:transposase
MSGTKRLAIVNAILYVAESGCKWAALPKRFGHWHTIYPRMAALFVMDVSHRSRISQIRLHRLLLVLSLTKLAYTPYNYAL